MKTALATIKTGRAFAYGGVQWVKLDDATNENGEVVSLVIAAQALFERAFGKENKWTKSSLRKELNGEFIDALIAEGAEKSAFTAMTVDLTADDGLDDYGTTTDYIALISCDQYRKYRRIIPNIGSWWWTVTPFSCESNRHSDYVRFVNSVGTLNGSSAHRGNGGVRPLCNLRSGLLVSIEESEDSAETQSVEMRGKNIETRIIALESRIAAVEEKNSSLEDRIAVLK